MSETIPDKITAIRAWRSWSVRDDGALLSINAGGGGFVVWPNHRPMEAECRASGHDAPQENCSCGVYAHKERGWVNEHYGQQAGSIGIVKLWGRVIEAERGYRAQFAEVEMIGVARSVTIYSRQSLATPLISGMMTTVAWAWASSSMAMVKPVMAGPIIARPAANIPVTPVIDVLTQLQADLIERVKARYPSVLVVPYERLRFAGMGKIKVSP